jgi:hypothetical protein
VYDTTGRLSCQFGRNNLGDDRFIGILVFIEGKGFIRSVWPLMATKKASLHPLALKYYGLCQKVSLPNGSSD